MEIGGRNYIYSQNTGSFEKNVQTLERRTSSDFKTPRSLLKNTWLRLVFSTLLRVWKSEEVLLLVFELLLHASALKLQLEHHLTALFSP